MMMLPRLSQSMIFELIVLAVFAYASHRLRPAKSTFSKYIESLHRKESSSIVGFVERFIGGGRGNRHFEFTDAFICWIVRVSGQGEGVETFIGIFNSWFPVSSFYSSSTEDTLIEMGNKVHKEGVDSLVNQLTLEAHKLKAASQYSEAALLYEKASRKAENGNDPFAASELIEESAKCYKMCNENAKYFGAVERAASLYQKRNRNGRAAALLEKAGKYCLELSDEYLPQAIKFLDKAKYLYEVESDGRGEGVEGERLQVMARLGKWEEASKGFLSHAMRLYERDALMVNTCNRYLSMSLFASLSNEQLFVRRVGEYSKQFPWFSKSRECNLARLMADYINNTTEKESLEFIEQLESEKYMIPSMPNWFESKWNDFIIQIRSDGPNDLC